MRVFVAGATGAIGRPLVRDLVAAGHDVTGTTRSAARADALRGAGATPVVVDALDDAALRAAVLDARPEVVVHELTDLSAPLQPAEVPRVDGGHEPAAHRVDAHAHRRGARGRRAADPRAVGVVPDPARGPAGARRVRARC